MKNSKNETFSVTIQSGDSKNDTLSITQAETTDGQPYYICKIDHNEIQLRKEDKWEQIWGDLDAKQVEEIGAAIDAHLNL